MKNLRTGVVNPNVDVLLLDSRDSFTFNIAQAFAELGASVDVVAADDTTSSAIISARPKLVCIGPGPRGPTQLPHLVDVARDLAGVIPIFGVCLGLQVLVRAFGGVVARALAPVHGKRDLVEHDGRFAFAELPSPLWVMRYHSLVAAEVPSRFDVCARDCDGQVMAIRDRAARIDAVQFHPESIGTAGGIVLLGNVARAAGVNVRDVAARAGSVPPASSSGPGFPDALYRRSVLTEWESP